MIGHDWRAVARNAPAILTVRMERRPISRRPVAVLLGRVCGAAAAIVIASLLLVSFERDGIRGWDALTYFAAGERLNAGHELYRLSTGDRPVWIDTNYWSAPLLSPPPIAIIWRPLAVIPESVAIGAWWVGAVLVAAGAMLAMLRRAPAIFGPALLAFSPAVAWELGVANVNSFLVGGIVGVWLFAREGRDREAGALIAAMAAVKVWPVVLVIWFVGQRRWRAVRWTLGVGAALALASIAVVGWGPHLEYLSIASETPPSQLSVANVLRVGFGLDVPWVGYAILVAGAVEVVALRHRPELAFGVTVVVMVLASPVVNPNTFAILLTAFAPFAWPSKPGPPGRQVFTDSGQFIGAPARS